jgi:flagellar operon protein
MIKPVMLDPTGGLEAPRPVPAPSQTKPSTAPGAASFADVLRDTVEAEGAVRFSAHAEQRLSERGIDLHGADTARIGRALDQAAGKGARETLVLMDRIALVASVPNRTVITALQQNELGDKVFTNIDSAVWVTDDVPNPPNL